MTDPTLHRTNLNLYATDVAWLEHTYGHGWTAVARELLHRRVEEIKATRLNMIGLPHEEDVDSGADPTQADSEPDSRGKALE